MIISWRALTNDYFMKDSVKWLFHERHWQMIISWRTLSNDYFMKGIDKWLFHGRHWQMIISWKKLSNDYFMKDTDKWLVHEGYWQLSVSWRTLINDYLMKNTIKWLYYVSYTVFFLINTLCALRFQNPLHAFEISVDPDQLASSEASLSGSTLFSSTWYQLNKKSHMPK